MSYYGQAIFEEKYENKHLDGKGINVNPCKKNIWAKIHVSPLSFKPQCPHLNDLLFCFSHPLFSRLLFPLLDCSASDYRQPPPPPLPSREAAIAPPSPSRCSLPFVHHQLWVAIPDLVWVDLRSPPHLTWPHRDVYYPAVAIADPVISAPHGRRTITRLLSSHEALKVLDKMPKWNYWFDYL